MSKPQITTTALTHQSTNDDKHLYFDQTIRTGYDYRKNMNFRLIHIPNGKL